MVVGVHRSGRLQGFAESLQQDLGYDKAILVVKAIVLDIQIFHIIRNGLSSELCKVCCKDPVIAGVGVTMVVK